MTGLPEALTIPAAAVDARLSQLFDEWRIEWASVDPLLGEIVDHLEHLIGAGGKRVRPAMAWWGHVAAGGSNGDPMIIELGAALELLQGFALFHDDIMDDSPTRRGAPTAHMGAAAMHRDAEWTGDARRYGEAIAILAGDVSLVLADVLLADVPSSVRRLWNQLRIEVNLGQFLDVAGSVRGPVGVSTARRIVELKTARYTIVRPLQMGAALTGSDHLESTFEQIGVPLGVAFQLRDDLLGVFGTPGQTGKPVGDDLREAKPTALLAHARAEASPEQRAILDRVGPSITKSEIAAIHDVMRTTGAVDRIESEIGALTEKSLDLLNATPLAADSSVQLGSLAHFLAGRTY